MKYYIIVWNYSDSTMESLDTEQEAIEHVKKLVDDGHELHNIEIIHGMKKLLVDGKFVNS